MTGMRALAVNTDAAAIRTETFRGRSYTVVPVVALVEGVIQGLNAASPEFAPADEFAKFPVTWDGRPVTLQHPRNNGELVSANSTEMLEEYQIGFLANTTRDGTKLKTEAWIDDELVTEKGDDAIAMMERIKSGDEYVEVSTGLFTETVKSAGVYNSTKYAITWGPVVPDHLAFLPDAIGACSVANGCGAPRLNAAGSTVFGLSLGTPLNLGAPTADCEACSKGEPCMGTKPQPSVNAGGSSDQSQPTSDTGTNTGGTSQEPAGAGDDAQKADGTGQPAEPAGPSASVVEETLTVEDGVQTKTTTTVTGTPEEVAAALATNEAKAQTLDRIVANAVPSGMTFSNIRDIIQEAIGQRWPAPASDCYDCCRYYTYITAITSDMVAFEKRENGDYTQVAVQYSITDDGGVTFTGEPVPVNLIVTITPKPGVTANEGLSGANQQQEEGHMTGTTTGGNTGAPGAPAVSTTPQTTTDAGGEQRANGAGDPVTPRTLESYLAEAPQELREVLEEGVAMRAHRRAELTKSIVANSNGLFAEADLNGKSIEELTKLATLAAPKADFTGRAMPAGYRSEGINANSGEQRANQNTVPQAPRAFERKTDTGSSQDNQSSAAQVA